MTNLTLSIDDQLIKQARIRVAQQGTSLSAKVRELLQEYVNGSDDAMRRQREEATANLMTAIELATKQTQTDAKPSSEAKTLTLRDEIYENDFRARDRAPAHPQAKDTLAG